MLLFQWGTNDWGRGRWFEYNVTRQLMSAGSGGDEGIWQLGLTLRYAPSSETDSIGRGNRWCANPTAIDEFREFIEKSEPAALAATLEANDTELRYGIAG